MTAAERFARRSSIRETTAWLKDSLSKAIRALAPMGSATPASQSLEHLARLRNFPMPSPSSRKSSPPELIERFSAALPADARIVRKPMFGYAAAFAEGNLVCSLYQDAVVVRLGKDGAARAIEARGARQFAPMPGRSMTGYVLVPPSDAAQEETLAVWLRQALDFTLTLPKKTAAKSRR